MEEPKKRRSYSFGQTLFAFRWTILVFSLIGKSSLAADSRYLVDLEDWIERAETFYEGRVEWRSKEFLRKGEFMDLKTAKKHYGVNHPLPPEDRWFEAENRFCWKGNKVNYWVKRDDWNYIIKKYRKEENTFIYNGTDWQSYWKEDTLTRAGVGDIKKEDAITKMIEMMPPLALIARLDIFYQEYGSLELQERTVSIGGYDCIVGRWTRYSEDDSRYLIDIFFAKQLNHLPVQIQFSDSKGKVLWNLTLDYQTSTDGGDPEILGWKSIVTDGERIVTSFEATVTALTPETQSDELFEFMYPDYVWINDRREEPWKTWIVLPGGKIRPVTEEERARVSGKAGNFYEYFYDTESGMAGLSAGGGKQKLIFGTLLILGCIAVFLSVLRKHQWG